jgi:GNAT superfamily N-acetyltransferase
MVFMGTEAFRLAVLSREHVDRAAAFFNYKPGGSDDIALRKNMVSGDWTVILAADGDTDIGGAYINWTPKYQVYQRMDLPEIQDLRVSPGHRRRGIATAIIEMAENQARQADKMGMGLSVGLHAGYGDAQRLYARIGYIPDGYGITYDRITVPAGEARKIDDDLALMLLKFF